jgi:hypothetical protein
MMKTPVYLLCLAMLGLAGFMVYKGKTATDAAQKKKYMVKAYAIAGAAGVIFWFLGFDEPVAIE